MLQDKSKPRFMCPVVDMRWNISLTLLITPWKFTKNMHFSHTKLFFKHIICFCKNLFFSWFSVPSGDLIKETVDIKVEHYSYKIHMLFSANHCQLIYPIIVTHIGTNNTLNQVQMFILKHICSSKCVQNKWEQDKYKVSET